jgi:hypothetical protein
VLSCALRPNKFVAIVEIGASSKTDGLVSPDDHQPLPVGICFAM